MLDPLPMHFWTIVLDGEPFIRYHIDVFKKLPFEWHWHIIEGVAELVHDTAWSVAAGGHVPERYPTGRSIDGTSEYLDELAAKYPEQVTIYRKPLGVRWDGKREMFNAPIGNVSRASLLWVVSSDELWTAEQFITGRKLFLERPEITAAFYWCWFFVGPDRVTCTRNTYGNESRLVWLRTWRFRPGMVWAAHEPEILTEQIGSDEWRDVGRANPIMHDQTEALGLVFQHYAYATLPQIAFKQEYYGYKGAVAGWLALQAVEEFPAPLARYFPWVRDATQVQRAEVYVEPLLFDAGLAGLMPPGAGRAKKPTIVVDGIFFQLDPASGIGRVWSSLLRQWSADGFAANVVILDRRSKAPKFEGFRHRVITEYNLAAAEKDRRFLQRLCDEEGADLFISTYNTTPLTTPSVYMVHDMIPEVFGADMNNPVWKLKHEAIRQAAAFICVSESTRRDLLRFFPEAAEKKISVVPHGVAPAFHPRSCAEIDGLHNKLGITKPYFLMVGDRAAGYKNALHSFRALALLAEAGNYQLLCTGPRQLEPEFAQLIPKGMTARHQWLADQDLSIAYGGAVALIYVSLYEGFGLPVLEAMACGCPVITCKNSALPEVAGEAAMYVSATDPAELAAAMLEVQKPEIRKTLIERGLARAKQFSWAASATKAKEILLQTAQSVQRIDS
ncbi:MAG: glycosyltransferase family 1 protein [Tepidisphaeraceae bacterium]